MAEVEEPQFTTLAQRIAALNQQTAGTKSSQFQTFGKRPPPPLPTSANRPGLEPRSKTTNNPPISTYGSSVTKQANNQPIGVKGSLLPPPPVDRDNPRPSNPINNAKFPAQLPIHQVPPPLPSRKASQPSPALPPRKASTQLARRGSNSSTTSYSSTVSAISGHSLNHISSATSASSTDTQRKLPPSFDQAKLPPLPPSRRELEEKAKLEEKARPEKTPLISAKSAPNVFRRESDDRDLAPRMPPRPGGPQTVLSRSTSRNNLADDELVPALPPRRAAVSAAPRSALTMGFNHPSKTETPNPAPKPTPTYNRPAVNIPTINKPTIARPTTTRTTAVELNSSNFDRIVFAGKPALVDFYAPYCKYCKELDPIWEQLGQDFAFASDELVVAKVDVDAHKSFLARFGIEGYPTIMFFDGHNETPERYAWQRDLESLTEFLTEKTGLSASDGAHANSQGPPPISLSSKPSAADVKAVITRPAPAVAPSGCLLCRDFSGPDKVATQYPRHSLPRTGDSTGYLAEVLCGPFPSATDKARAIFTWLHHNIAYDTVAFFGNNVKNVDPKDTITSGLAVCGGYAGLYVAIALKAGLECVMVTGHGKGYGYTALSPGDSIPPRNPAGHAWNAVRIDGGEWKLLDPCWGAGNVGNQVYNKHFTPSMFTMRNEDFGLKHFPQDDAYFFRSDGRIPTWEEYIIGPTGSEPLQLFGSVEDHGLSGVSFTPAAKHISVNGSGVVRFQFSKVCEHWDHEKNGQGKPYCMILKIHGLDGRKDDFLAFENNDVWWWADVHAKDLGCKGQTITAYAVTTVNGKDARGMTRGEYLNKKGRCGMGFGGIAAWELV